MTDRYPTDPFGGPPPYDPFDDRPRGPVRRPAPLPPWLKRRLLRGDEEVTWVAGPRFNPSWERYVTHPLLLVAALGLGLLCVGMGALTTEMWDYSLLSAVLTAFGLFFGALILLGVANGYFTRLVATNYRLLMLQGYEVYRRWDIDDLPRHLVRYRRTAAGEDAPTIDLDAMHTMLGGASDQFVDAKTILAFGKQLGGIRRREEGRR